MSRIFSKGDIVRIIEPKLNYQLDINEDEYTDYGSIGKILGIKDQNNKQSDDITNMVFSSIAYESATKGYETIYTIELENGDIFHTRGYRIELITPYYQVRKERMDKIINIYEQIDIELTKDITSEIKERLRYLRKQLHLMTSEFADEEVINFAKRNYTLMLQGKL